MSSQPSCRSCGQAGLAPIMSFGELPLANELVSPERLHEPEPRYPLDLAFCQSCALVQITHSVPPRLMFEEYPYFSSVSDEMLRHSRASAARLIQERSLGPDSLVVEIGSNDGYMLRAFQEARIPVLGIEPARNVARVARERGVTTLNDFFSRDLARDLAAQGIQADVMLANNVMAHAPDINGVMEGIRTLLKPGGVFVMETPYVREMIEKIEFDTIYHEHLFYYSLTSLEDLYRRHGLAAMDVERLSIHGGSLRASVVHQGSEPTRPAVCTLLDSEAADGLAGIDYYASFADRVHALGSELTGMLRRFKSEGKRIAAYGASAKGTTLLNFFGIGGDLLDFVADRSPYKQGRYTPGTQLLIRSPEALLVDRPDYLLLLAWNFADEIIAQQSAYRASGGKFIVPIPTPRVV